MPRAARKANSAIKALDDRIAREFETKRALQSQIDACESRIRLLDEVRTAFAAVKEAQ